MTDILAAWEENTPRGRLRRSAWEGTARRFEWGNQMADDEGPSVETLYVGQAMANAVLYKLALSLATQLAHTAPQERMAAGADVLRQTLADYAAAADTHTHEITDLPTGAYDPEIARQMATDALDDTLRDIRMLVLRTKE